LEDRGSFNGTYVNGVRMPPRIPQPLRHYDRIRIGAVALVFMEEGQTIDPYTTIGLRPGLESDAAILSPFQLQVVKCLCADWVDHGSLDSVPSNRDIAERLGTPNAEPAVKAALRRAYGKAGLTDLPPQAKRRQLCRIARQRGWI
jgi:predicted component of type VI protein secretion system